ncbi:hypothetical protein ACFCWG_25225 [Streptomyces sp. NPDC056390]|uniref:hypothetical protein n=1 Tax=Streptomyces sp. NPDC056390 TaxID=3345806 RepID=UPI0035DFD315
MSWDKAGNAVPDATTGIGFRRYLRPPAFVTTTRVRVVVTDARLAPDVTSPALRTE